MNDFIRVPLFSAVAALTLTGCNMSSNCKDAETGKTTTAAATSTTGTTGGQATATGGATTKVTRTVVTRTYKPGRRERVGGGYRYSETRYAGGYSGGYRGDRYSGTSVSVSETETSSSSYRYAESEERYGGGGGYYASGATSSGGYAQSGAVYAAPAPAAAYPVHHRGYRLAATDERGYLTWPGKVE